MLYEVITIYGAGVIGSEYASAFRGLDVKVNLVNTRQRMLEFLDDEISDALSYHMRDEEGILIRQNEEYERVEVLHDGVVLHLKTVITSYSIHYTKLYEKTSVQHCSEMPMESITWTQMRESPS